MRIWLILLVLLHVRDAAADGGDSSQLGDRSHRALVAEYCEDFPADEDCRALFGYCLNAYDSPGHPDKEECRELGFAPHHAMSRLGDVCTSSPDACATLRHECRSTGAAQCTTVAAILCPPEGCALRALCTPTNLTEACDLAVMVMQYFLSARYGKIMDPELVDGASHQLTAAISLRRLKKMFGAFGPSFGVDFAGGAAYGDGRLRLSYDMVFVVGGGFRIGDLFAAGLDIGGAFDGMYEGAWALGIPLDAWGLLNLGSVQILGFVQPRWSFYDENDARQGGSELLGDLAGFDELTVTLHAMLHALASQPGGSRVGYGVDVTMREYRGTRVFFLGINVGGYTN